MSEYPKKLLSPDGSVCIPQNAEDEAALREVWGQNQSAPIPAEELKVEDAAPAKKKGKK